MKNNNQRAFTLIELMVVVAVLAVLVSILLPALGGARSARQQTVGVSNLRQLAVGWNMYTLDNDQVILPGRHAKKPGGTANRDNHYQVGNGLKYRPRWIATLGAYVDLHGFSNPSVTDDRQDYDHEVFYCPTTPDRTDERNSSYGYNHQFLGNARVTDGRAHNFPVRVSRLRGFDRTVMAGDCMGTAAGFPEGSRAAYQNDGTGMDALGNHGWTLDPPRLTDVSDRGTGDPNSPRTAIEARHPGGKANVVFCDTRAGSFTPHELGYRTDALGIFIDGDTEGDGAASNSLFSGRGGDADPPVVPGK